MSSETTAEVPPGNVTGRVGSVFFLVAHPLAGGAFVVDSYAQGRGPFAMSIAFVVIMMCVFIAAARLAFSVTVTVSADTLVIRNWTGRHEIPRSSVAWVVADGPRFAPAMRVLVVDHAGRQIQVETYLTESKRLAADRARGLAAVLRVPHYFSDRRGPVRWD